ncbi:hypothetical protein [Streptomyces broussonetiae]|uniref:Integral membrane protein n=1 Tax=Streptomyces broussonetiae TaxID=2686304 RepID=A0ABV5EI54_9ACTN
MSTTRAPGRPAGSYAAPALTLEPGRIRNNALVIIGVPLLLIVVLAIALQVTGEDDSPYSGTDYGSGDSLFGDSVPDGAPGESGDVPSWPDGITDEPTDDYFGQEPTEEPTEDLTDEFTDTATGGAYADDPKAQTVVAYFTAINDGDYTTAWDLGGQNLVADYESFSDGFATTAAVSVTIDDVTGDLVLATVTSLESDDTQKVFDGSYTVRDGVITAADVTERL